MTPYSDRMNERIVVRGVAVAPGVAWGQAVFHESDVDIPILAISEDDVGEELKRLSAALRTTKRHLAALEKNLAQEVGERDARIFAVQGLLLDDPEFRKSMRNRVRRDLVNAEVAVRDEVDEWSRRLRGLSAESERDPGADLRDVGRQVLRVLAGKPRQVPVEGDGIERLIMVAEEFLPSDAANIDRAQLAAIVTVSGGVASHAAILARSLGIPSVTFVEATGLPHHGRRWIVDGNSGQVIVNPTDVEIAEAEARSRDYREFRAALEAETRDFARTKDDVAVELMLNIDVADDLTPESLESLNGVGLYRTEFLYMNRPFFPSEAEQYRHYCDVLRKVGDREVTFRTIDVGGDKPLPYLSVPHEPNPVLGWRGIRLSLEWPDMLYSQLRALLRASAHGRMRVLAPMVTTVEETRRVVAIVREIQSDLKQHDIPFDPDMPVGMMIEIPAAALATGLIARECDFISVGTNDLSQYALAVDRNNSRVADLYQQFHPGLLRLLRDTIGQAGRAEVPLCVCGELAGNPEATLLLLGLGLRSFSMSAYDIPMVKRVVAATDLAYARKVATQAFELVDIADIRAHLRAATLEVAPDLRSLMESDR